MIQDRDRIVGATEARRAGVWALSAAAGLAFSGLLAGCGGNDNSGELVKADPVVEQQVKSMTDYYKTNPPGKARRK